MSQRNRHRIAAAILVCLTAAALATISACGDDDATKDGSDAPDASVSPVPGMSLDQAVDELVADGYPQEQSRFLNSLGSSDLGFRIAGTAAEKQAAEHVADELSGMGLSNVRLEAVPVDAWEFKGASVTVAAGEMQASSFAGVPGTPADGITGEVVYVGAGSSDEYDAAGDVTGKIVLLDTFFEEYWINLQCGEATARGATAVISTYGPTSAPWYGETPDALGSNDGEYDRSFAPVVYVSRSDGDALKKSLRAGPVEATVRSDVTLTMAEDGGTGHSVVAELPGSSSDGSMIVVGGHIDAHFRAGGDDTGAVSTTLTMAKAMVMSGYKPERTIVFYFDTAEEYGYTDCYFDWIIGAWYAITQEHPDWPGKAVAYINLETMAEKGSRLTVDAPAELKPWLDTLSTRQASGLDKAPSVSGTVSSWSNGWTFTAAGVPTITLAAARKDYGERYHTDVETDANLDWELMGAIAKYAASLTDGLDQGAPPYSLGTAAGAVVDSLEAPALEAAGADPEKVARLTAAAAAYKEAATAADARIAAMTRDRQKALSGELMAVEKTFCKGTLALSIWEEQILPHQQVAYDAAMLQATIDACKAGKKQAALGSLVEVSNTWNAYFVSEEVAVADAARWAPDYPKLTWGAQSHLPPVLNVWPQYELIEEGKLAEAAGALQPILASEVTVLDERIDELATVLEQLTTQVGALQ